MKYINQHDLIEPWALRAWHIDYKVFTGLMSRKERLNARKRMLKIRREAALERKLEAAQRTIEAQAAELAQVKKWIDELNFIGIDSSQRYDYRSKVRHDQIGREP